MLSRFEKLVKLQQKAYAPYSKFQVAAILVMKNGDEYLGVNVENASYGATICAERTAFSSAITSMAETGVTAEAGEYTEIHLLAGSSDSFPMPCGLCRQVINEFVGDDFKIVTYNQKGVSQNCTMADLLPHSFNKGDIV